MECDKVTEMNLYEMWAEKNKLEEFSDMEGTEVGEMCCTLLQLANYPDYMSKELRDAVAKEIMEQIKYFEENYEWVDVEVPARPASTRREFVQK
jgi:hypothetical protein